MDFILQLINLCLGDKILVCEKYMFNLYQKRKALISEFPLKAARTRFGGDIHIESDWANQEKINHIIIYKFGLSVCLFVCLFGCHILRHKRDIAL